MQTSMYVEITWREKCLSTSTMKTKTIFWWLSRCVPVLAGLGLLVCGPVSIAQGIVFEDDFESGDALVWSALYTNVTGVSLSVTTNEAYSGSYAAKVSVPSASGKAILEAPVTITNQGYFRAAFYIPVDFAIGTNCWLTFFGPANSTVGMCDSIRLKRLANGNLVCSSSLSGDGSSVVPLGQWNSIEVLYHSGSGTGEAAFWLNGVQQQYKTNLNLNTSVNSVDAGYIQNSWLAGANISGTFYLDDVQVSDQYCGALSSKVSLYYPDFRGRAGVKVLTILHGARAGDSFEALIQSGNTSNLIYSAAPISGGAFYFPVEVSRCATGEHAVVARLKADDGSLRAEGIIKFNKNYGRDSRLTIDVDNNLTLDGKKFFPVTEFGAEIQNIPFWITNSYVNCMFGQGWWLPSTNNMAKYLSCVGNYGVPMIGPMNLASNSVRNLSLVDDYISVLRDNTNFIGYVWGDEPDFNGYAYEDVKSWYEETKNLDGARVVQMNFMGTSFGGNSAQRKVGKAWSYPNLVADIYGFDLYPVYNTNLTFRQIATAAVNLNKFNRGLIPFFGFVQTCNGSPTSQQPTAAQLKMMSWLLVVNGVKGVQWYHYGGTTSPECYAEMARFTKDISVLTQVLLSNDAAPTFSWTETDAPSGSTYFMIRSSGGGQYIFAVNILNQPVHVCVNINGLRAQEAISVYGSEEVLTAVAGGFVDTLPPYGVKIYRHAVDASIPPPVLVPPGNLRVVR